MVRWANRKDESYMKIVILDGYTENPGDLSWEGFEALGDLTVYDRTTVRLLSALGMLKSY